VGSCMNNILPRIKTVLQVLPCILLSISYITNPYEFSRNNIRTNIGILMLSVVVWFLDWYGIM
jgi:hypothetical protein